MDEQTYKAIRGQWEAERSDSLSNATRLAGQIKDLDRTWRKLAGGSESSENAGQNGTVVLRNGTLTAKVTAAVSELPEMFESPAVWQAVLHANPGVEDGVNFRASVANVLKSLVTGGKIEITRAPAGSRPASYRRIMTAPVEGGAALSG